MKKKFIPLILVLLTGCGLGHIEDTNGDDTRVATISDEKILGVSSHSSFMMVSNSIQKKGVTTGSVKSSKFSGVKKIESFNKTIVINIHFIFVKYQALFIYFNILSKSIILKH